MDFNDIDDIRIDCGVPSEDYVIVSSCSDSLPRTLHITKDCNYDVRCEINIPIPAFENKNIGDLLKVFSAKEIMECKNNLTHEEEEKLKLILELSK